MTAQPDDDVTERGVWDLYPEHVHEEMPRAVDWGDLDPDTYQVVRHPRESDPDLATWEGFHDEVRRQVYHRLPGYVSRADESHDVERSAEMLAQSIRPQVLDLARARMKARGGTYYDSTRGAWI